MIKYNIRIIYAMNILLCIYNNHKHTFYVFLMALLEYRASRKRSNVQPEYCSLLCLILLGVIKHK